MSAHRPNFCLQVWGCECVVASPSFEPARPLAPACTCSWGAEGGEDGASAWARPHRPPPGADTAPPFHPDPARFRAAQVLSECIKQSECGTAATIRMDDNLTAFEDCLGGCERILKTPIPVRARGV